MLSSEDVQAGIAEQLFTVQGLDSESTVFDKALEEAVNRALGIETLGMDGVEGESGTLSDAIASAVDTRMSDYGFTPPAEETGSEDLGFRDSEGRQIDPVTGEVIGPSTALLSSGEGEVILPQEVQAGIQYLIDSALVDVRADVTKTNTVAGVALVTATAALASAVAAIGKANEALTAAANVKCDCKCDSSSDGTTHTAATDSDQRNPSWLGGGRSM